MTWDGAFYDEIADPQADSGGALLYRLAVPSGATVVDAGCGSGRVTQALLEGRPDVRVVGLDTSSSMLDAARRRLADHAGRLQLRLADLSEPWPVDEPADAVVSTHAFHWVHDHRRLYRNAFAALRPGGSLVAVAGGDGSLQRIRDAAQELGVGVAGENTYATAADTATWLEAAGFVDVWAWL